MFFSSNQQLAQSQKTATIHPSYSSRCRPRSDDESRFVYGRYRQPPQQQQQQQQSQQPQQQPLLQQQQQQPVHQPQQQQPQNRHPSHHSPHSYGHHTHHGHAHGHSAHGPHSSHHSSHTHLQQDDDGIYDSADHHGQLIDGRINRETPDSERYVKFDRKSSPFFFFCFFSGHLNFKIKKK